MICQNCGATHGCGCQQKIASDGKSCCTSCLATYQASLNSTPPQQNPTPQQAHVGIQIQSITYSHNYTG